MFDVPSGWHSASLGELSEIFCSNVDKKSHPPPELPIKLCNYQEVYRNDVISHDLSFMSATASLAEISRFSIQKGDVLITKDSESPRDIAVSAYVLDALENIVCGYHLVILRPIPTQLLGAYLHQLFGLHHIQSYVYLQANGITRFGLTKPVIQKMPVIYPSLAEQRRIVAALMAMDQLILVSEAQYKKLHHLKKGLLQRLLKQGWHNPLVVTEGAADLPAGWCLRRLGDVVTLKYGKTCRKLVSAYGRYPIFGSSGVIGYSDDYLFDGISIVLGRKGTINNPYYVEDKGWVIDTAFYLQDFRGVYPRWLFYLLTAIDLNFYNEATGVPSLSRETFYRIPFKQPPLAEQYQIADKLSAVDRYIAACLARLQHYRRLKKALRQAMLTGKARFPTTQKLSA
jgi:type I restriction enzyme S subunit